MTEVEGGALQPDDGRQPIALWIPQAISLAHLTFTHKWTGIENQETVVRQDVGEPPRYNRFHTWILNEMKCADR